MSFVSVAVAGALGNVAGSLSGLAQHVQTEQERMAQLQAMQNAYGKTPATPPTYSSCVPNQPVGMTALYDRAVMSAPYVPADPICAWCGTRAGKTECRNCGAGKA